jgi:hypothetical protein
MKTRILSAIIAAVCCSATFSLLAQTVDFNSLPLAVQDAINTQRGPAGIISIQRLNRVGTPVYDVRLDRPGINNELYVTDTGAVVNGSEIVGVPSSGLAETREIAFSMLPTTVQNRVRAQLGNVATPNADMITVNGQTTYVVPSRVDGQLTDLWIDPAGNLITLSPPRILLSNAKTMRPDQLPAAVQDTLRTYAAGAPILNVIRGDVQGLTVYDATISRNGHTTDLRMAADGSLVRDAVNDRYLAETGRMTRSALAVNAPVRIPLSDPVSVSFNQLPLPVLSTLQRYAGADFVEHIDRGLANGRTQYEALFRHTGEEIPLRIAEDGALVHDRINELFLANYGGTHPLGLGVAPSTQVGFGSSTVP